MTPAYVRQALTHIAPSRPHRLVACNIASVDDDPAAARAAVRPALEVVGEPDWRPHITPLPFHDELVSVRSRCDSPRELARSLPDEWVGQLAVAGTSRQARSRLSDLFDAGVSSAVLAPLGSDCLASLNSLVAVLRTVHRRRPRAIAAIGPCGGEGEEVRAVRRGGRARR